MNKWLGQMVGLQAIKVPLMLEHYLNNIAPTHSLMINKPV
jgi:hypothetical protein